MPGPSCPSGLRGLLGLLCLLGLLGPLGLLGLLTLPGCLVSFGAPGGDGGPTGDASGMGDASGIGDGSLPDGMLPDGGPNCGDGVLDGDEQCDDGNQSNTDDCTNACNLARCGDSVIHQGVEECDDGNSSDADSCLGDCRSARCGDGFIWGGFETCDDGGTLGGDGCSMACQTETGYSCAGQPSVCGAVCGDGWIREGEACDDGDIQGGDGCTATCNVESGYSCGGEPSICTPVCGDGLTRGTEGCDDGNLTDGDGCSSSCGVEALPTLHSVGGGPTWTSRLITYAFQAHAPSPAVYPIVAAAEVSDTREAFVFTNTTYHVADLTSFSWVDSGSLGSLFPGLPPAGRTLHSAMGASFGTTADIYFMYDDLAYIYTYTYATGTATAAGGNPYTLTHWTACCGATVPAGGSLVASWFDPMNNLGWTSGAYSTICNPGCPCGVDNCTYGQVGPFDAHLTWSGTLHLKDLGCCDRFFSQMPASSFPPFTKAGAPAISQVSAAFYDGGTDRLYVITYP